MENRCSNGAALPGSSKPQTASLTLREGEILGIAGLIGAGRTESLRACFGLDRIHGGAVFVRSVEATHQTPAQRLASGIGLLSEDRKVEGLMLNRSLADNLTITRYEPVTRFGFIQGGRQRQVTQEWIKRLEVRAQ